MTPELLINELECQDLAHDKLTANTQQVAKCKMGTWLQFTCGSDAGVADKLLYGPG